MLNAMKMEQAHEEANGVAMNAGPVASGGPIVAGPIVVELQ